MNFARRDLRARFKGTLFGIMWSLMLPMATLATYSLVFGVFFKAVSAAPPMGSGHDPIFPLFLFAGLVPWGMYSVTLSTAIASLLGNGPLMKKIYFPAYASVFGSVGASFYQSLIEIGILSIALLAFLNIGASWLLLIPWVVLFGVFVAAVSLMLAVMNVYLRDTAYLVSIALTLQFYLTPIIYQETLIPGVSHGFPLRTFFTLQPLAAFIDVFRSLTYELSTGRARSWVAMLVWTLLATGAAWLFYRRRGLDLSEEL